MKLRMLSDDNITRREILMQKYGQNNLLGHLN